LEEAVALIDAKAKNGKGKSARKPAQKARPPAAKKAEAAPARKPAKKAPAKAATKRPRPGPKPPHSA
jgi:hypothetical protein